MSIYTNCTDVEILPFVFIWGGYYATPLDIEVDPQRRRFFRREADFALQRLVECRALEPDRGVPVAM